MSKTRTKSKSKIDRLFDDKAPRNRRLKNFNEFADDVTEFVEDVIPDSNLAMQKRNNKILQY